MQEFIQPSLFNVQFMRTLGHTTYQGAEIGECFAILNNIEKGNQNSWYEQWFSFAEKNALRAKDYSKKNLNFDAKMAFLRASNYYRTSFFFLEDEPEDERIEGALKASIDAFHNALDLFDTPVEKVLIPYRSDLALPGYLYLNTSSPMKEKPILIDTGGGDGTKEESYFGTAAEALKRGFHCLCFEGPGQGSVLRLQKIPFIPEWEQVIEKVIDFVIKRPEVDKNNIILMGRSFGGYLAARAVTKEKRIRACIVDPGIFESSSSIEEKVKSLVDKKFPALKDVPLSQALEHLMNEDENMRFMLASRKWRFGAQTIEEMLNATKAYTLQGIVKQIQCSMLVCDNTQEYITYGQAKKLYDELQCKKHYILFNSEEGTGGHCEPLAPRLFNAAIYNWLKSELTIK
ncbi:prolyl oligopeptidase [Legionella beliardensis]|uniref:Prolyl oligopeptidase n=1 Tax=Legionella beliardensis TaxID=91822 RepID=A0A378I246_9GAMM|nr:alpha/beta fold hydrolase [Legionella beliardensis]STX29248.1 prolyl oligopeptidase [Legionella beliardensis]